MHPGFGKAAEYTFTAIEQVLINAVANNKVAIHSAHSRGCPRAVGAAILSVGKHGLVSRQYLFNPPPSLTKKGVKRYKMLEL